jgi:iron complex transport system ATP-binding protein
MTITADQVSWKAAGRLIVDRITLAAPTGTTLGLLGPNGSGKSSLLRLISGMRPLASGVVTLGKTDIATMGRAAIARRAAFVEQHAGTEAPVTVQDVVRLGRTPHRGPLSTWTERDEAAVETALAQAGLTDKRHQRWHTLSGGERQRAHIARALAQCPTELLLDEPTNHLDIQHQLDILSLITRLPFTSIIALHDLNLAAMFCDTMALLHQGHLVAIGRPEEVLTPQRITDIFGVQAHVERSPHHGKLHVQFLRESCGFCRKFS